MSGTLLIIDDLKAVRAEMIEILRRDGAFTEFLEATDGAAGFKIMKELERGIDVVACDLNMPTLDGFGFLRLVQACKELEGIPIIMVTGATEEIEVVKAFELGANDYITKPFQAEILLSRFANMLQIKILQDELISQKNEMERMATTDALTGISNRRYLMKNLQYEIRRAARYGASLAVLMCDLDRFKAVNDRYGHQTGDSVLRETAELLTGQMRRVDRAARYGGEEFVLILPSTDRAGAAVAAERMRASVEKNRFHGLESKGQLTISIGVAIYDGEGEKTAEDLINEADSALYQAKEGGRNRVEIIPAPVK